VTGSHLECGGGVMRKHGRLNRARSAPFRKGVTTNEARLESLIRGHATSFALADFQRLRTRFSGAMGLPLNTQGTIVVAAHHGKEDHDHLLQSGSFNKARAACLRAHRRISRGDSTNAHRYWFGRTFRSAVPVYVGDHILGFSRPRMMRRTELRNLRDHYAAAPRVGLQTNGAT